MTLYEKYPHLLEERLERERERLLRGPVPRRPPMLRPVRERMIEAGIDFDALITKVTREANREARSRPDLAWYFEA